MTLMMDMISAIISIEKRSVMVRHKFTHDARFHPLVISPLYTLCSTKLVFHAYCVLYSLLDSPCFFTCDKLDPQLPQLFSLTHAALTRSLLRSLVSCIRAHSRCLYTSHQLLYRPLKFKIFKDYLPW
jgi:hypothetical protein